LISNKINAILFKNKISIITLGVGVKTALYCLIFAGMMSLSAMEKDAMLDGQTLIAESDSSDVQPSDKKQIEDLKAISIPGLLQYIFTLEELDARAHLKKLPPVLVEKLQEFAQNPNILMRALEDGRVHAATLLLNLLDVDITTKNKYGYTALQIAAANCASAVPLILNAAKKYFFKDEFLIMPYSTQIKLMAGTPGGEFEHCLKLFKAYVNYFAPDRNSALHLACRHQPDAIPCLLTHGADANASFCYTYDAQKYQGTAFLEAAARRQKTKDADDELLTPLMEAAKNKAATRYIPDLIRADAYAWKWSFLGAFALDYAIMFENIDAIEYLTKRMATDDEPATGEQNWNNRVPYFIACAEQHLKNPEDLEKVRSLLLKDYDEEGD
jgi:ankyrin repeat protein